MNVTPATTMEPSAKSAPKPRRPRDPGKPRPFLKWAGGKRQLLPVIRAALPEIKGRYFEPFVGGGAVFFDLSPRRAVLSDANAELINCYLAVRDRVGALIRALRGHVYDKEHYYRIRALLPETLDEVERAARTIFLNKTGFNGLYRVNSKGVFNVPFGRFKNPNICDEPTLRACSARLAGVELRHRPFEWVLDVVGAGDVELARHIGAAARPERGRDEGAQKKRAWPGDRVHHRDPQGGAPRGDQ